MYIFFVKWEDFTTSYIIVEKYDIKDNALFLYKAEIHYEAHTEIQTIPAMVIPFCSIRYFTYEQRKEQI